MITPTKSTISGILKRHCAQFDIKDIRKVRQLSSVLDSSAQHFAQNFTAREETGTDPELWTGLRQLWREVADAQLSYSSPNDDQSHIQSQNEEEYTTTLRSFCMALAKFTRNIVAGVPENQLRAFDNEPDIRRLLYYYTSWTMLQADGSVDAARLLAQVLSNTVTSNDGLVQTLWVSYMDLPEEEAVLIRLLAIDDHKTLVTTLIFVLNCLHQNTMRKQLMIKSNVGIRICISLLDKMVMLHEAEKGSDGARAFDIGYAIISEFIKSGLLPELYKRFFMKGEVITPHQTTLLKLLDSYLLSTQPHASDMQISDALRIHQSLSSFLAKRFFMFSDYAQRAIHRSLGMTPMSTIKKSEATMRDSVSFRSESSSELGTTRSKSSTLQQVNIMLPNICEALVLVTQCIVTVSLEAEEQQIRLENGESTYANYTDVKRYFNRKKYQESGLVESLIDLLSLLDVFLPRINFGKPVNRDGTPAQVTATNGVDPTVGFSFLKRDLVRLLGVLCHGVKSVQDRAREAGGLPVIMNMCVVDERNPYLREHAILTMRNLLMDNFENQRFVDSVKPAKEWDVDGTLKSRVKMSKIK